MREDSLCLDYYAAPLPASRSTVKPCDLKLLNADTLANRKRTFKSMVVDGSRRPAPMLKRMNLRPGLKNLVVPVALSTLTPAGTVNTATNEPSTEIALLFLNVSVRLTV